MEIDNIQWVMFLAMLSWLVFASTAARYFSTREKRRSNELKTVHAALTAHYDAMDRIVDNPDLPLDALKFLSRLGKIISSKDDCTYFVNAMMAGKPKQGDVPSWFDEIERLSKTNPSLVEDFQNALASGMIVVFLRWPGNGWKLQRLFQQMAADRRRETALAERIAKEHCRNRNGHGGDIFPSGLVPA